MFPTCVTPESIPPASPAALVPPPCLGHQHWVWISALVHLSISVPFSLSCAPCLPSSPWSQVHVSHGRVSPCQEHPWCQHCHMVPGVPHPSVLAYWGVVSSTATTSTLEALRALTTVLALPPPQTGISILKQLCQLLWQPRPFPALHSLVLCCPLFILLICSTEHP